MNKTKLAGNSMAGVMTMNQQVIDADVLAYTQLQRQIRHALRAQHPEWIQPNGDCPTCDSYERRLAELLRLTNSSALDQKMESVVNTSRFA